MTPEEFDAYIRLSENSEKSLELVNGEVVERLSAPFYAARMAFLIGLLARQAHHKFSLLGAVTFALGPDRYIPNVTYTHNPPYLPDAVLLPYTPDLAVEIITQEEYAHHVRHKRQAYLEAGTTLWEIHHHWIDVYERGKSPQILGQDDTLTGGNLLPDFAVSVRETLEYGI